MSERERAKSINSKPLKMFTVHYIGKTKMRLGGSVVFLERL